MMDVIVIGCGAAGVAALRKLHDAGLKVMGLEAADRIGGRLRTVEFGDNVVDIGAAWCHGEKDNIVFDLANPLDLLGTPGQGHTWYLLSNGDLIPQEVGHQINSAINDVVAMTDKNSTTSILECVQYSANTNEVLKKYPDLTKSFIENYERLNHLGGQDDSKKGKSLKGLEEHWPCEGEFMLNWKGKGYSTILDVLLNKYPHRQNEVPVEILFNKEVETIRWKPSQAGMSTNPLVQVKCKDGSLYISKSVIVTMSIGVLKERQSELFNPPLPPNKISTINSLQLCVLDKIYIEFVSPWWLKTPASFHLLWREEDKQKFTEDEQWITEIASLDTVEYQPNVLLAFIYGKGAVAMENVSLSEVRAGMEKLMNVMLRKEFKVSPIRNVIRSQWASNPLIRGAYSYRSVATEESGGDGAILLSEPLYYGEYPVVCFAGEATSHHRHSAVHGAIESGFREADRLITKFESLQTEMMDVIVIGCGAAGVAALRKLHDAGLKVMGLEAADRIGGRLRTVEFGDNVVDLGAAWCLGAKDNIVFELVSHLDLLGTPGQGHTWYLLSNGNLIPQEVGQQINSAINDVVAMADKNSTTSILECVQDSANTNEVLNKFPELTNAFIENYERLNQLGGQDDPKKGKSLKGLEEYWPCEGEYMQNWKDKGYSTILDVLLNKYPDALNEIPIHILFNKEVETIRWKPSQAGMSTNPLVQVKCKDGSLYISKSVIVTMSLGVLKERHSELFNPPLPPNKISTINSLQLCVLDKIYIEFVSPWWLKTPASFHLLWREEDKQQFTEDEQWITEIASLDTVEYQPNVLVAFIYGRGAVAMENVSLGALHWGMEKLMNVMLRKQFQVSRVKCVMRSQWASNPLIRGAYSYRSVATEENGGDGAILLSEPLYHGEYPVVCFAGEATSHHRHSAVHGAIESGFREADRLVKRFTK